jgi:predicted transcriptional regulator
MSKKLPTLEQIEERRNFLGMTKGQLCKAVGISYPTYRKYLVSGTSQAKIAELRNALRKFAEGLL